MPIIKEARLQFFVKIYSKQGKTLLLGRYSKDKCRHIPDKLKLVKATPKKRKNKTISETKCSNCGQMVHKRSDCIEVLKKPTKMKRKNAGEVSIKEMEDCFFKSNIK